MQWVDEVRLETPEQIDVDLELAGLGSRLVAQLVDWAVKILLSALLGLAVIVIMSLAGRLPQSDKPPMLLLALAVAALYMLWLGYDIYYEAVHHGQTPGKRYAGIRVIREGGGPLDFQAACIRNLLGIADLLPQFYVLGAILIALTPRRQRLGDLAAGTIVIRERALGAPTDVAETLAALARDEYRFTAGHLARCTPADRQVLRSFLQRWPIMEPDSRATLARRIAQLLLDKTGFEPVRAIESGQRAAEFLASLFRDLEEHRR
jgi:uncharacterized RDD family membrane protein YckC